jgi:hypothetical protein
MYDGGDDDKLPDLFYSKQSCKHVNAIFPDGDAEAVKLTNKLSAEQK